MNWLTKLATLIKQKPVTVLLVVFFAIITLKLISLYISANMDEGQWEQFKVEHHCQPQASDGNLSWKCDDGAIYYRWRQQR